MHVNSVTIAIPISDLALSRVWYDKLFEMNPSLEPAPGILEYEVGGAWVQLVGRRRGGSGWVLGYGVNDLHDERERLEGLGIAVGAIETVPGVVSFFEFRDPDGNQLSCYRVLAADASS